MPRRSKRIRTATQSGGTFGNLPRAIVVHMLKYFDIHEVARLQRLVCREFRDAGQERIRERGGRKLYEEGMAFYFGYEHQTIDKSRGISLLDASSGAGCRLDALFDRLYEENLSEEDKQKILKDLKEIATTSPYHWVDYYIGKWYEQGFGGEENKNKAVVWWTKSINGGNAQAMSNLGFAYEEGNLGLTQSPTKANELYALAAEKGHAAARYNLGNNYENGTGVEIDYNRCVELLEQSAKQGHVEAQFNLSNLYRKGSQDNENGNPMTIPVNHPLHFKWAMAAAKQNHIGGQAYTAECYQRGWGVEPNDETAFEWWMKAAVQEDSIAQRFVGQFFEYGKGRDIDLVQALFWYQKAEAQGDQWAADAVERLS
jgi:TPR repeat protein